MLRLMTFNANGIRSADKKGFWTWFDAQSTDILCVQELKAQEADISEAMKKRPGYHAYFHCAVKKGIRGAAYGRKSSPDMCRSVSEFPNLMTKVGTSGSILSIRR